MLRNGLEKIRKEWERGRMYISAFVKRDTTCITKEFIFEWGVFGGHSLEKDFLIFLFSFVLVSYLMCLQILILKKKILLQQMENFQKINLKNHNLEFLMD